MKISLALLYLNCILVSCAVMTDNRIGDWVKRQIELQRHSAMRFTGRHNVLQPNSIATKEIIDFDFHAEMSGFVDLNMIQIRRLGDAEKAFDTTAKDENEMVQQAIEHLESDTTTSYDRITFENVFINHDGMLAVLQTWANRTYYGGRVDFDTKNTSDDLDSQTPAPSDYSRISVRAVWKYKWEKPQARCSPRRVLQSPPNIRTGPRPVTWDWRIQHAMVDGEHGVIGLGDEIVGAPMMKAIAKYALREPLKMQGNFGTCKIHTWGMDEPNDEPPYAGTRRFGESVRDPPPAYTE